MDNSRNGITRRDEPAAPEQNAAAELVAAAEQDVPLMPGESQPAVPEPDGPPDTPQQRGGPAPDEPGTGDEAAEARAASGLQPARKPIIIVDNLRKVYRIGAEKVVALNSISLTIGQGEFCCLLGTSGSGKSTLLNMMAGLEKPTRGTVTIRGEKVSAMSEKQLARFRQKHLGFIFQSYNLLPALTAVENVALPLTFKGIPRRIRERRAEQLLAAVGLRSHARHKPSQMSGGQQQRVGIARAFAAAPSIIFADEPTGNLDSRTTLEVLELMKSLARKRNQTLVMVTHDNEIAKYADRIVRIIDGNIKEIIVQNEQYGRNS